MLVSIQIPIVDLRNFVDPCLRLARPSWPAPQVGGEFIRAFGPVRRRPSGGLNGWLGEASICDASKGVRFSKLRKDIASSKSISFASPVYRRFFFDGLATGKIEIGLQIRGKSTCNDISDIISDSLNISMQGWVDKNLLKDVKEGTKRPSRYIGVFGTDFAKMYADATTPHGIKLEDVKRLIVAGRPCVIIEHSGRPLRTPKFSRKIEKSEHKLTCTDVTFWHEQKFSQEIPVWSFSTSSSEKRDDLRKIRIYLSRFHAESEALEKVLLMIDVEGIKPDTDSSGFQYMQKFFFDNLKHQQRDGRRIDNFLESEFYFEALRQRDKALPGYYDGLVSKLEQMEMRKGVNVKVFAHLEKMRALEQSVSIIAKEVHMTKVVNKGIAGIVGANVSGSAAVVSANQTVLGAVNKPEIEELSMLAKLLAERAQNADEEVSAQAISSAVEKLSQGDEAAALAWLKRSGKWALTVAESVGAKLAAELIVRALTA